MEGVAGVGGGEVTAVIGNDGGNGIALFRGDIRCFLCVEGDVNGACAPVLAERGDGFQVRVDLFLWDALRSFLFCELLLHAHGDHDRIDQLVSVFQLPGIFEAGHQLVHIGADIGVFQSFPLWCLHDHLRSGGGEGIVGCVEAFFDFVLGFNGFQAGDSEVIGQRL